MGESNRVAVRFSAESTFGEVPSSPAMQALLRTGGGLEGVTDTEVSQGVRSDRMRQGLFRTGQHVEGGYDFELAYGQQDVLLSQALCGSWSTAVAMAETTIAAVAADDTFTDSGSGFVSEGIQAGMWILVQGFTDAANNGLYRVGTVVAGTLTPDRRIDLVTQQYSATVALNDEAAGDAVTIRNAGMLRNGTAATSMLFEEEFEDTTDFFTYRGCRISQFDLNIAAKSLITGSFSVMGKSFHRSGSTVSGGNTAVNSNLAYNTSENVWGLSEGGADFDETIQAISFSLNNNCRYIDAVGNLTPPAIPYGTQDLTGSLSLFMGSGSDATIDKYINFTESSQSFVLSNGSSPLYYVITFPALKYSSGIPVAGGLDEDTQVELNWTAYKGSGSYQIQIDRITTA